MSGRQKRDNMLITKQKTFLACDCGSCANGDGDVGYAQIGESRGI